MNQELGIKHKSLTLVVFLAALFSIHYSLFTRLAFAHCPLCVAGAAAGITLTRWVGIDDSITGIWIAALLGAGSFWFDTYLLNKFGKRINAEIKRFVRPFLYLLIFVLTIYSFYKFQLVIRMSQIAGLDKLTFGMLTGGILFYLVDLANSAIIKKNKKVYFPYQRVIVSLGSMIIWSLAVFVLINYYI